MSTNIIFCLDKHHIFPHTWGDKHPFISNIFHYIMFISNPRWLGDLNQGQDLHSLRADQAMTLLAERRSGWAYDIYDMDHLEMCHPHSPHRYMWSNTYRSRSCTLKLAELLVSAKQCGKINEDHTPILIYPVLYYLPDFTPCYHLGRFQEAAATPGERCTPEWSHKPNASLWSTGWILAVNYEAVRRTVRHSLIFTSLRLQGAAGRRKEETGGDGMDLDRNCVSCGKSEHHEIVVSSGFIGWYSFSTQ